MEVCDVCALGKIKEKIMNQNNENKSETPGERIYFDISSITNSSLGGSKYWM